MQPRPSLLRSGLVSGWSFLVFSAVWLRLADFYNGALVSAANAVLGDDLWLTEFARTITVHHTVGGRELRQSTDSLVLHSGLLIVLALVAGTPSRRWRWRIITGTFLIGSFFLLQTAAMVAYATFLKSSLTGAVAGGDVQVGFAIFWALTPLIVGSAFAYLFWLPAFRTRSSEDGQAGREHPKRERSPRRGGRTG